ncbi:alpha/beta fold hydrolase [Colwellia sp. 1_MG-2023]|uniref:alpha/beta fold hydrolase n=1 Tax=unclassified Colwellia TaxID=196834 RepID=UPI002090820E|nr:MULTISPECIES: alpha/beta fold hydrolase [unclassified Colwellia]MDO6651069.1 alpha/beta fold hydrolase [Colwellia sp. 3_MG-2023]MDO6664104.1 alpha/beta fold hydrolase [Colwellia sp. 2_MG-2023]MDO6688455.1 alpha/beta fold hydrolase [Colwellia sp. 1_MG-2023]
MAKNKMAAKNLSQLNDDQLHNKQLSERHLHYQQLGQGEHIVLIHGLFGSLENLNMVAKGLSKHYCVTSIDVRNHGNSFHRQGMNYHELAQDVINLLDSLAIESCCILGHSMGGKIAMQIALSFPKRIKKLIVADIAPIKYPAHHLTIIKGLQALDLSKVKKRKDADDQLAIYVDNVGVRQFLLRNLSINEDEQFSFRCNLANIEQGYHQIMQGIEMNKGPFTGDTLFIKGGNSDYILPEHQSVISTLFPNAKAKVIQGAGHWLHAEKTVAFNKLTLDFLS